jgi:large subunit ribosomal protein L1
MSAKGKRYRELYSRVDREHQYSPAEAVQLVRGMQSAKFAETVECHIRTGLNVRHAEEQLRGTITLPHMAGTDVTVVVFARGEKARDAEAAGADVVGDDDLAERIQGGWTDFDVAIASPDLMPVVGRLGRVLGPQGKMPNPKVGTVTDDVGKAVAEAKAGRMEYRTDRHAIVHLAIGKTNLSDRELLENYAAVIDELVRAKPAAAKGRYLRTITLATTFGPGVRVDPARTRDIVEELSGDGEGDGAAPADAPEPAAA